MISAFVVVAALGVASLSFWVSSSTLIGLSLILSFYVIDTLLGGLPALRLGLSIYPADILFCLLLIATMIRILTKRGSLSPHIVLWTVLGLSILGAFISGYSQLGT